MDAIGTLQSLVDISSESEQESKPVQPQNGSITEEHVQFVKSLQNPGMFGLKGFLFSVDDVSDVSISGDVLTAMIESFLEKYD